MAYERHTQLTRNTRYKRAKILGTYSVSPMSLRHTPGLRMGQFDPLSLVGDASSIEQDVSSLIGGGPPDGSSSDPRIVDLNNAYNAALAGNTGPTGLGYLTAWINDQPPHPAYSNTYAKQLLSNYAAAKAGGVTAMPATSSSNASAPPQVVQGGPGLGGLSMTTLAIGAAAVIGLVVLTR